MFCAKKSMARMDGGALLPTPLQAALYVDCAGEVWTCPGAGAWSIIQARQTPKPAPPGSPVEVGKGRGPWPEIVPCRGRAVKTESESAGKGGPPGRRDGSGRGSEVLQCGVGRFWKVTWEQVQSRLGWIEGHE